MAVRTLRIETVLLVLLAAAFDCGSLSLFAQQPTGCYQGNTSPARTQVKAVFETNSKDDNQHRSAKEATKSVVPIVHLTSGYYSDPPASEVEHQPFVHPDGEDHRFAPLPEQRKFLTRSAVWMEPKELSGNELQATEVPARGVDTPMQSLTIDISPQMGEREGERILPDDHASQQFGSLDGPIHAGLGVSRSWQSTHLCWTAPSFYHRPLYFERPNLERYGHYHRGTLTESALSTAHFFGSVAVLPYKVGANPSCDWVYTLGRDRPGNCVPHRIERVELNERGIAFQAAAVTGAVFVIP